MIHTFGMILFTLWSGFIPDILVPAAAWGLSWLELPTDEPEGIAVTSGYNRGRPGGLPFRFVKGGSSCCRR